MVSAFVRAIGVDSLCNCFSIESIATNGVSLVVPGCAGTYGVLSIATRGGTLITCGVAKCKNSSLVPGSGGVCGVSAFARRLVSSLYNCSSIE